MADRQVKVARSLGQDMTNFHRCLGQPALLNSADSPGFTMSGAELIVGSYGSWPFNLGTAVGVIPYGKGKIVFSTLNVANKLNDASGAAEVARRILCNYINFK